MGKFADNVALASSIAGVVLLLVIPAGWILNVWQLVTMLMTMTMTSATTTLLVIKVVGMFFAPLGVVLGWVGLFF